MQCTTLTQNINNYSIQIDRYMLIGMVVTICNEASAWSSCDGEEELINALRHQLVTVHTS